MQKINKTSKILMFIFMILAFLCPVMYNIIGVSIDKDGTLNEPFYLVIFMYLFITITLVCLFIYVISKIKLIRK